MRLLESDREFAIKRAKKIMSVYKTGEVSCHFRYFDDDTNDYEPVEIIFEYKLVDYSFDYSDEKCWVHLNLVNLFNANCTMQRVNINGHDSRCLVYDDKNHLPYRDVIGFHDHIIWEILKKLIKFNVHVLPSSYIPLYLYNKEVKYKI